MALIYCNNVIYITGGRCVDFSTTPECQAAIYNHIRVDRESGLPSSMEYSLFSWHSTGDKNIIKTISQHRGSDVQDDTIGRISAPQDTVVFIWLYSIDWFGMVVFKIVGMMIIQGINRLHPLHRRYRRIESICPRDGP
jgi:hypothetical protein